MRQTLSQIVNFSKIVAADRQKVPECIVGQTGVGDPHAKLGARHGRSEPRQGIYRLQCKTQKERCLLN